MIDLTKIPKLAIWVAIAIFVILILYFGYNYIIYKISKPYERFLIVDCFYSNGTSIAIITAKENIRNIVVSDINLNNKCEIKLLYKDSMDLCKINNFIEGGKVFIKLNFEINNKTFSAVSECKIEEKKGLISWLFGK